MSEARQRIKGNETSILPAIHSPRRVEGTQGALPRRSTHNQHLPGAPQVIGSPRSCATSTGAPPATIHENRDEGLIVCETGQDRFILQCRQNTEQQRNACSVNFQVGHRLPSEEQQSYRGGRHKEAMCVGRHKEAMCVYQKSKNSGKLSGKQVKWICNGELGATSIQYDHADAILQRPNSVTLQYGEVTGMMKHGSDSNKVNIKYGHTKESVLNGKQKAMSSALRKASKPAATKQPATNKNKTVHQLTKPARLQPLIPVT